jgi:hypothetical protein
MGTHASVEWEDGTTSNLPTKQLQKQASLRKQAAELPAVGDTYSASGGVIWTVEHVPQDSSDPEKHVHFSSGPSQNDRSMTLKQLQGLVDRGQWTKRSSLQHKAQAAPLVVGDRVRIDYLGSVLKGTVKNVTQPGPESVQQLSVIFDHAPNDEVQLHSDQVRKVTAGFESQAHPAKAE